MDEIQKKQVEVWARRFVRELAAVESLEELGEVLIENGNHLGHAETHNPQARARVQEAINERFKELGKCHAITSSASTAKETGGNTPSTSTASDPPSATE